MSGARAVSRSSLALVLLKLTRRTDSSQMSSDLRIVQSSENQLDLMSRFLFHNVHIPLRIQHSRVLA